MNDPLPDVLRERVSESLPQFEESGFTLEIFDSSEHTEKTSFGIYAEKGGRGFYLTAWNSGEVQVSTVDFEDDPSPHERHLSDVHADRLRTEFEKLVDWVTGSSDQS